MSNRKTGTQSIDPIQWQRRSSAGLYVKYPSGSMVHTGSMSYEYLMERYHCKMYCSQPDKKIIILEVDFSKQFLLHSQKRGDKFYENRYPRFVRGGTLRPVK